MMPPKTLPNLTLYSSSVSNASARLRIAMNLKQLPYRLVDVNLSRGQQHDPLFLALNPSRTVPLLVHQHEDPSPDTIIGQSIAALEYLDEAFPDTKRLLPEEPAARARVRTLVALLASDTHPLLTHRVATAMKEAYPEIDVGKREEDWNKYWVSQGFTKFENMLKGYGSMGECCLGNEVSLADVVLVPEVWYAKRIGVFMDAFPSIEKIWSHVCQLEAVRQEEQTPEEGT